MSIKARLLYILIILFINGYSNSIGSTVIPIIASLLFFIILIPPLSKITKVDLLHEKFIELAFKKAKHKATQAKPVKTPKEQKKEEAKHTQVEQKETANNKTVKDLIAESLKGALKEFTSKPPNEAYSSGDGYFSWYLHIKDNEDMELTNNTEDYFYDERFECSCVKCDVSLLEDVIMNDSTDFSEVEADVKDCFKAYLNESNESILKESADKVDLSKSYFRVVVYEVTNSGEDEHVYYHKDHYFEYCLDNDMSSRDKALSLVKRGVSIQELEDNYKNDKEIAMIAIENDPYSLKYLSDILKNDREVAMAAITRTGWALSHASADLKNDREIVMAAVSTDGAAIEYAPEDLKNDREIVMAAVSNSGTAIEYLSDYFKNDKEIVMTAASNGIFWAIEYVSDELKNDKEVIMTAIKDNGILLEYASDELKNDKEVVMAAVKDCEDALEHASDTLKSDKDILELIKASN